MQVIYNNRTRRFILWINYLAPASSPLKAYPNASYVVAASDTPLGPFTVVTPKAAVAVAGGGDFALLVDGQTAYIAYDAWKDDHRVSIEQLNEVRPGLRWESILCVCVCTLYMHVCVYVCALYVCD